MTKYVVQELCAGRWYSIPKRTFTSHEVATAWVGGNTRRYRVKTVKA